MVQPLHDIAQNVMIVLLLVQLLVQIIAVPNVAKDAVGTVQEIA